ncbi:MAG: cobalamin biosynthesis protein CobD [Deferribacteres bacterium]|nr:cobalamin biosynthesis protein CobD [Deferribacteres bacterium]
MTDTAALVLAYILDLLIGDPRQIPHPVKGMGWAIDRTGRMLREKIINRQHAAQDSGRRVKSKNPISIACAFLKRAEDRLSLEAREKLAGVILVVIIAGLTYFLFHIITSVLLEVRLTVVTSYVLFAVFVYLVSTTVATRDLLKSATAVISEAGTGSIENARRKLGMIVGRDTHSLDRKSILKAVIETLSENASDGIVAPMFYFALGGLPLAMAYKAVNTLDSMVGYRNETYKNFGWAAARLDDIANYIPARITGFLIVAAAFMICFFRVVGGEFSRWFKNTGTASKIKLSELLVNLKLGFSQSNFRSGINAFKIMFRDGMKHSSPNSGIPEAAMAGALGVRLGGPATYGGIFVNKPYIGEEHPSLLRQGAGRLGVDDEIGYVRACEKALMIVKITSVLGLFTALLIMYLL